ncbi:unnamed protein product [Staurois parvus]|uniref:Uncharacterized protein n=1 Tax=Staurois parvus TaxID=386267 RepID=A0ABN9E2P5_9NEOB|nr:unnamed protein product [Staurois parvus]
MTSSRQSLELLPLAYLRVTSLWSRDFIRIYAYPGWSTHLSTFSANHYEGFPPSLC